MRWFVPISLLAIGVLYATQPSASSSTKAKTTVASSTPKTDTSTTELIPADYKVHFASLTTKPKDVFTPLVSKATAAGADGDVGGIPAGLAGGGDWQYTGMVQVNGAAQALLENTKTGDINYVGLGQQWKKAKVRRISDSAIELVSDSGKVTTVKMSDGPKETTPNPNTVAANTDATQQGQLTGPIGAGGVAPLPAFPVGGQGFNGRRGFGGRGRRGFGGGGGVGVVTADGG
jgi:hypothetical protein